MTLMDCLVGCQVFELRAIARRQGLRLHSLLKGDIISQLHGHLINSFQDGRLYSTLPDACQSAMAMLLDAGGSMPLREIEGHFGLFRSIIPGAIESRQPWGDGQSTPLDDLHCWGLLFRSAAAPDSAERAIIPVDIVEKLRPAALSRPKVFRPCAHPASVPAATEFLCHNIMLLASALHDAPVVCRSGGVVPRKDLFKLNSYLLTPEDITEVGADRSARNFFFLRSLAESLGVIQCSDGRLTPGPGLPEWLRMDPEQRRFQAVLRWIDLDASVEFDSIPALQFTPLPDRSVLASARRFLLTLLAEASPGEWHTFSSLVQAARLRNSLLLRQPGDGTVVRCTETGRDLTPREWAAVEGAWIEACVREPLHWLGLVEPGCSRRGELTAFRISKDPVLLCRAVNQLAGDGGPAATASPSPSGQQNTTLAGQSPYLLVKDDLEVEIDANFDLASWFQLERICELVRRDRVSRYRISREKVRQTLQSDIAPETILQWLGPAVPEAVRGTILSWSNRFGQVRVFTTTVLTTAEPALLSELRAVPEIAACLEQRLGSRSYAVLPGREDEIINWLRSRGEMPHVEQAAPVQLQPEAWREIQRSLRLWKESARRTGKPGPSESVCEMVDAAIAHLEPNDRVDVSNPAGTPIESDRMLGLLEEAVARQRTITFEYEAPEEECQRLTVQPKSIVQQGGVSFLSGYRKGAGGKTRFRIDSIRNITFTTT